VTDRHTDDDGTYRANMPPHGKKSLLRFDRITAVNEFYGFLCWNAVYIASL